MVIEEEIVCRVPGERCLQAVSGGFSVPGIELEFPGLKFWGGGLRMEGCV